MDVELAALFYIGIIIPTLITIFVFLGFLLCLYKRNLKRKMTRLSRRALPATPLSMPRQATSRSFDKFDKCSQHSADSAIDMAEMETSLEEKLASGGLVLDTRSLDKSHHSYQNEGMQLMTEAEIHTMGALRKGFYPSHDKLNQEIHSQVKIYEKMCDVQRVALQIQQRGESLKPCEKQLAATAAHRQFSKLQQAEKASSRYTSASKLVPAALPPPPSNSNQLDKDNGNYASYSPSWYADDSSDSNNHHADIYRSRHHASATASWKPNISTASCSSNTDNYPSVESSHV